MNETIDRPKFSRSSRAPSKLWRNIINSNAQLKNTDRRVWQVRTWDSGGEFMPNIAN